MRRRDLLTTIGTGAVAASVPAVAAGQGRRSDASPAAVVRSDSFKALHHNLSSQGKPIKIGHVESIRTDKGKVYTMPVGKNHSRPADRSDSRVYAAETTNGVHAVAQVGDEYYIATPKTVDKYASGLVSFAATNDTSELGETIQKGTAEPFNKNDRIRAQSHADDVLLAWNYLGTYDIEDLCGILEPTGALLGTYSLIEGFSIKSLEGLAKIFARVSLAGIAGCYTEDIAEKIGQFALDCPQDKYLYEVYTAKWWFPKKTPVIVAKCP